MEPKRVVIKVGSSSITTPEGEIDLQRMAALASGIATLYQAHYLPVLVSSGAVAAGLTRLPFKRVTMTMPEKQAAAAVGQGLLMEYYNELFNRLGVTVAQILLTREDLASRKRYLNARNTINALLDHEVLPIVNENDTVSFNEIRFGDNDTLSALTAGLVEAELLVLLTDIDGLYNADPHSDHTAQLIPVVEEINEQIASMAGDSSSTVGTGGMTTKIRAARMATRSGIKVIIANSCRPDIFSDIIAGTNPGTTFMPARDRLKGRKQWIAYGTVPRGKITIDRGAEAALIQDKCSLLAVGITAVSGNFAAGSVVSILSSEGKELGRGIVNLSAGDLRLIKGASRRGYEVINRDWLVC